MEDSTLKTYAGCVYKPEYGADGHEFYVLEVTPDMVCEIMNMQRHVKAAEAFGMEKFWYGNLNVFDGAVAVPPDTVFPDNDKDDWDPGDFCDVARQRLDIPELVVMSDSFKLTWVPKHGCCHDECSTHTIPIKEVVPRTRKAKTK